MDLYTQSLMGAFWFVLLYLIVHYETLPRAPIPVKVVVALALAALPTTRQVPAPFDYATSGIAGFVATVAAGYPWRRRPMAQCLAYGLTWGVVAAYVTRAIPNAFGPRRWWSWVEVFVTWGLARYVSDWQLDQNAGDTT